MKHEGRIESIRTRLLNLARSRGENFDFILSRYGVECFLQRLAGSEASESFVLILKGAMVFQIWNRELHCPRAFPPIPMNHSGCIQTNPGSGGSLP